MGVLIRYDRQGKPHAAVFENVDDFHAALGDFFLKVAGPRADGKLSQLEYAIERIGTVIVGTKQCHLSGNDIEKRLNFVLKVLGDIGRDVKYARESLEKINGGNQKGQSVFD